MNQAILPHMNGGSQTNGFQPNGSQTNGSSAYPSQVWLKQTVQQFFNGVNWDDHPPEIQTLRLAGQGQSQSSMLLTVSQFFSTINWEGDAAAPPKPISASPAPANDAFTLEDFSDLF